MHGRRRPHGLVDQAELAGGPYLGALAHESRIDRDAVLDGSSVVNAVDGVGKEADVLVVAADREGVGRDGETAAACPWPCVRCTPKI
jgi:hypothetical protein